MFNEPLLKAIYKDLEFNRGSKEVLLFVHGFDTKTRDYRGLIEYLVDGMGMEFDFVPFKYSAWLFSCKSPKKLAKRLQQKIEELAERYETIHICGHSVGSMLIRQAIVNGLTGPTTEKIDRVVFLSATNRGYIITKTVHKALYFLISRSLWILGLLAVGLALYFREIPSAPSYAIPIVLIWVLLAFNFPHYDLLKRMFLVPNVLKGSDWVIGLRLQWMAKFPKSTPFKIFHIRGEEDHLVDKDDNAELFQYGNSHEIVVPNAGHHVFMMTPRAGKRKFEKDQKRIAKVAPAIKKAIHDCFHDSVEQEQDKQNDQEQLYRAISKKDSKKLVEETDLVVLLIHGIRDFGEWQETLASRIKSLADQKGISIKIIPVRYGYFSAFQFVFPMERNRVTKSFLDRYTQARGANREATFAVAAHSNGTYVFAKPLSNDDLNIDIERVYLAGCVLPKSFKWSKLANRVQVIRNDCAGSDWPVGALCWLLNVVTVGVLGVGTGGVYGFDDTDGFGVAADEKENRFTNNRYLDGDHGVALESNRHEEIADFIVTGDSRIASGKDDKHLKPGVLWGWRLLFIGAIALVVYCFWWLQGTLPDKPSVMISTAIATFIFIRGLMSV